MERPDFCIEKYCRPVFCDYRKEYMERGGSATCIGVLEQPVKFIYDEVEHVNDCRFCYVTPLKGVVKFLINADDAWADYVAFAHLLNVKKPLVCKECGPISHVGNSLLVFGEDEKYCIACAVRLGKIKWHPENKRYY